MFGGRDFIFVMIYVEVCSRCTDLIYLKQYITIFFFLTFKMFSVRQNLRLFPQTMKEIWGSVLVLSQRLLMMLFLSHDYSKQIYSRHTCCNVFDQWYSLQFSALVFFFWRDQMNGINIASVCKCFSFCHCALVALHVLFMSFENHIY